MKLEWLYAWNVDFENPGIFPEVAYPSTVCCMEYDIEA